MLLCKKNGYCFRADAPVDKVRSLFKTLPVFLNELDKSFGDVFTFLEEAVVPVVQNHTVEFLDVAYKMDCVLSQRTLFGSQYRTGSILDCLDLEQIITWADSSGKRMFIAEICSPFTSGNKEWSGVAKRLLDSEDGVDILRVFIRKFHPNFWSGSLYEILEKRLALFRNLVGDSALGIAVQSALPELERTTKSAKEWEQNLNKRRTYEQFEY